MKPFKEIIKENITLVIALALPIVLALFFMLARHIGHVTTPPPQHDFLVATKHWNSSNSALDFKVVAGELITTFTYPEKKDNGSYNYKQVPDIYYVDSETMIAEPVPLPLPSNWRNPPMAKEGDAMDLFMPGISDKTWTAAKISPDGYDFGRTERYDHNLMTEIFSSSRSHRRPYAISKDGRSEKIRGLPENTYRLHLIAWEKTQ
jgi:hypothetical protein